VTQLQGFTVQSVGYLSKDLDPMAKGWSGIWAFAAVGLLVPEAQKFTLNRPLRVHTPHDLGELLNSKGRLL
jgi:hypothetical protein